MYIISCWVENPTLKLNQVYSYLSNEPVVQGARVEINFNNRLIVGFCESCEETNESPDEIQERLQMRLKFIESVIDKESLITNELHELGLWMASDTISPVISCFSSMLPSKVKPSSNHQNIQTQRWVRLTDEEVSLTVRQLEVYEYIKEKGEIKYSEGIRDFKTILKTLHGKNAIEIFEKEKVAEEEGDVTISQPLPLSPSQKIAKDSIKNGTKDVYLLHGVTGSGKTEIYLQLAKEVIDEGKQVLFLVPEIGLTPQMKQRVRSRFGKDVAIYHSGLNPQEKYEQYRRVKKNEVSVVVGTRSSVFMPFHNLGLIIMDEEHDPSYKQDNTPQYHCRDIAIHRAHSFNAKVILGSATPALESYARAIKGVYELVELSERINKTTPKINVVSLKKGIRNRESYLLSNTLKEKIQGCLDSKHQVILLLNRRGYSNTLRCKNCQEVIMCPHCDLAMSYHRDEKVMKCHTCGTAIPVPSICPKCGKNAGYSSYGYGTQKVEEELHEVFPTARLIRMDADTTTKKNSHERIFKAFENYEADILLGTQMIAKGLDYPRVTLVGILNGDAGLNRSDYRSVEATFDLMVQASGRSGRSKEEGEVVLQVFDEDHYSVKCAEKNDYKSFFAQEMKFRHAGEYPPYSFLISILVSSQNQNRALKTAHRVKALVQGNHKTLGVIELLKIKDNYRYRVLLKGKDLEEMKHITNEAVETIYKENGNAQIKVDVNPLLLD